jgi:hypothetical protein
VTDVPGDPARPFFADTVRQKFRRLAGPVIGAGAAAEMLELAFGLFDADSRAAELFQAIEQASNAPEREQLK